MDVIYAFSSITLPATLYRYVRFPRDAALRYHVYCVVLARHAGSFNAPQQCLSRRASKEHSIGLPTSEVVFQKYLHSLYTLCRKMQGILLGSASIKNNSLTAHFPQGAELVETNAA